MESLDITCGTLVPLRWSSLCAIYRYDHDGSCRANAVRDKSFKFNVLVQTTRGSWHFRGRRGAQDIVPGIAVAGVHDDRFGCRHDGAAGDSNIIAALLPGAIDPDAGPLFVRQIIPWDLAGSLERIGRAGNEAHFESRMFELFDAVSLASRQDSSRQRIHHVRVQRVKRFIEQHAFEHIALSDIADCVGLSPFACLREFKAGTGETPHAYLSALRFRRAQALLRDGNEGIRDVAAAVGMDDPCYFSRWFLKASGMAPARFRNSARLSKCSKGGNGG